MKIREAIGLAVLLLIAIGGVIAQGSKAKSSRLESVIQELAPIARLTNGIALQTELSKDPKKVDDVVAEFLGVQSGEQLLKLKTMEMESVAKSLKEFYEVVENVPQMNVDMQALKQSFEALEEMKTNAGVLKVNVTDPSAQLIQEVDDTKIIEGDSHYKTESFRTVADKLQIIKDRDSLTVSNAWTSVLEPLKTAVTNVQGQLNQWKQPENSLGSLFKLQNMSENLSNLEKLGNLTKQFSLNFDAFSTMNQKLGALKTGMQGLQALKEKKDSLPALINSLNESSSTLQILKSAPPTLKLTAGFPQSLVDLKLLLLELNSGIFKKLISQGKDTSELKKMLSLIPKFTETFEKLNDFWKTFNNNFKQTSLDEVLSSMRSSVLVSSGNLNLSNLGVDSVLNCFQNLAAPQQTPNFEAVEQVFQFSKKLSQQIIDFKSFLDGKKTVFNDLVRTVSTLRGVIQTLKSSFSPVEIKPIWDQVRNDSGTADLIKSMRSVVTDFAKFQEENPFITLQETVDWTVIPTLLNNVNGTNMDTMLDCAQKATYNPNDIASALSFGSSAQMMKTKKQEFNSTQAYLKMLANMKSGLLDVEKTVTNFKKTPSSRRRRAASSKSLINLQNAPDVSASLGKGVQVLREYCKILETQESVMVAVNAVDPLKSAVDGILGAQSVWTDNNRKDMGVMVTDLNKLETFVGTMRKDNISELWKVFGEAGKVPDFTVDAKIFKDPISMELANNADLQVKSKKVDFQNIGGLNLDFSRHRLDLTGASQTLQPLQQFFDDFFDNNKNVGGAQGSVQANSTDASGLNMGILAAGVIGGLLLLVGLGVGGRYLQRYMKEKQKWKNPERYWCYDRYQSATEDKEQNIVLAAAEGRVPVIDRLVKNGVYMDTYASFVVETQPSPIWLTALHAAVYFAHPEAVEFLIRSGADRTLLSNRNQTAEQLVESIVTDRAHEINWQNLRKILKIFRKYEKKKFHPRLPQLFDQGLFCVDVRTPKDQLNPVHNQFDDLYPSILFESNEKRRASHLVFETDEAGILNLNNIPVEETDDVHVERLLVILSPALLVKMTWIGECVKDKKNFHKDYEHRITKFKYNGKVYESLEELQKWAAKWTIPILANCSIAFYTPKNLTRVPNKRQIELISRLTAPGLTVHDVVNNSSKRLHKPYWFPEKSNSWILHDKEHVPNPTAPDFVALQFEAADLKTEFVMMNMEEFSEFLFGLKGWKELGGGTQKNTNTQSSVHESTLKSVTSQKTA